MATPTTPRISAKVSTSMPAARTNLTSVSQTPNAVAATRPGQRAYSPRAPSGFMESIASVMNERAGAELGEQFEQHRVRHLAVENDHTLDAALQRIDAVLDLGDHAARNGAVGNQAARLVDRQLLDELLRLVEHARHVGQQQKTLGLERAGEGA